MIIILALIVFSFILFGFIFIQLPLFAKILWLAIGGKIKEGKTKKTDFY